MGLLKWLYRIEKIMLNIQLDYVIFERFLQFTVFPLNLRSYLFLYGWIEHSFLYRTVYLWRKFGEILKTLKKTFSTEFSVFFSDDYSPLDR